MRRIFFLFFTTFLLHVGLFAQTPVAVTELITAPGSCSAEIRATKPKIYIANFFVTYGKKDMGKAIGDYIAQRFESDGRFEVVPRAEIDTTMAPFFKNKKATGDQYLQRTLELAAGQGADCVIFGRISKRKNKVLFSVRMSAVATGNGARKVDTEVERDAAISFLEGVGDSFVSYFVNAAPVVVPKEATSGNIRGFYIAANGTGIIPFGFVRDGFTWGSGGSFEFGRKGWLSEDLFFGINGEYLYYFKSSDNFSSLYGASVVGLAGYEWVTSGSLHLQLVLYGGYQLGRLIGAIETVDYGYGLFMAGNRAVYNLNARWGIMGEARYVLAVASSTKISSVGFSLGAQWRF
ncbi:MAG: hypothetical protein KF713_01415 [Turneriella sp.]|nr:hypothetical protein [Turneriella sp.]